MFIHQMPYYCTKQKYNENLFSLYTVPFCLFLIYLCFFEIGSPRSLSWPGTRYPDQDSLELTKDLPASLSCVLRLKVCTNMPGITLLFKMLNSPSYQPHFFQEGLDDTSNLAKC